jgi:hypothetical protein
MSSLELAAFAVLAVVSWFATAFLVSAIGGWWELAEHYRSRAPAPPALHRWESGRLGAITRYNSILFVGADDRGLYLAVPRFFRTAHKPLSIPWSDIGLETRSTFFGPRLRLNFIRTAGIYLEVSETLGNDLLHDGGRTPFTSPMPHAPAF